MSLRKKMRHLRRGKEKGQKFDKDILKPKPGLSGKDIIKRLSEITPEEHRKTLERIWTPEAKKEFRYIALRGAMEHLKMKMTGYG